MPEMTFLDSPDELVSPEPQPGQKRRGRPPGRKSYGAVEKEFGDELEALMRMMALMLSMRDPVCGNALNQTCSNIAKDIARLAASSPKARKYLTQTMEFGRIVPLMLHIQPLIMTVYQHHVADRVHQDSDQTDEATSWPNASPGQN